MISYEPETGRLFRNGQEIGGLMAHGYVQMFIGGKHRTGHRLAFWVMTGRWPKHQIDHIDHNRSNNRWDNLREVSKADNRRNCRLGKRNKSGVVGVRKSPSGRYIARIRNHQIGTFDTKDEAVMWRKVAEAALGFHENHGSDFSSHRA